jgi:hypothetical protein
MAKLEELSVGIRVKVYDAPDCPREAQVVAVNDEEETPGKFIGVQFDQHVPVAHECDGLCEKGYGWWTRPENVSVIE